MELPEISSLLERASEQLQVLYMNLLCMCQH